MSGVEVSVEMRAEPTAVWEVLADVERLDEWLTVHVEFEEDPPGVIEEGSELQQKVSSGEFGARVEWVVETLEEPELMCWRGTATGGAELRTTYRLVPTDGGTRVECATDFELPGGPLGSLAAKVAAPRGREEAEASLDRLRRIVEQS